MARLPVPTWCFAITVVRNGDRFLIVQERKHGQTWYFPAGRLEPCESFFDAARRETMEEAGIPIELEGILRIEHGVGADATARMRVLFLARPVDDRPLKSQPDDESLGARWATIRELAALPLRGPEVKATFEAVLHGAPVYPLSVLAEEGSAL